MADIRYDVGVITEVVAGVETDDFDDTPSTPNRIVLQVPKFKWPLTIGWFGHSDLCETLQELSMAGVKVKATYLHTDPVGQGEDARRYRNLIKVETQNGEIVEVPGAEDSASFSKGTVTSTPSGGTATASSAEGLRLMALNTAAVMLGSGGGLTGKWGQDIVTVEAHAREILKTIGADESVAEGYVEDEAF